MRRRYLLLVLVLAACGAEPAAPHLTPDAGARPDIQEDSGRPLPDAGSDSGDEPPACEDSDQDGLCGPRGGNDCDDDDPTRFPGNEEVCDGVDNDCRSDWPFDNPDWPLECGPFCTPQGCAPLREVSVGVDHGCSLSEAGALACWGGGGGGQLARPGLTFSTHPLEIGGVVGVIDIDADGALSCALTATDMVCWGSGIAAPYRVALVEPGVEVQVLGDSGYPDSIGPNACVRSARGDVRCYRAAESGLIGESVLWRTGISAIRGNGSRLCMLAGTSVTCHGFEGQPALTHDGVQDGVFAVSRAGDLCVKHNEAISCVSAGVSVLEPTYELTRPDLRELHVHGAFLFGVFGDGVHQIAGSEIENLTGAIHVDLADHSCAGFADGIVRCWGYPLPRYTVDEPVSLVYQSKAYTVGSPAQATASQPVLLGDVPRGACDNFEDLHRLLVGTAPLSAACAACIASYEACAGATCREEQMLCAGLPVGFISMVTVEVPSACATGNECARARSSGQPCEHDQDCASRMCGIAEAQAALDPARVCLNPLGSRYDPASCGASWDLGWESCSRLCDSTDACGPDGECVNGRCALSCARSFAGEHTCRSGDCVAGVGPNAGYYCR